MDTNFTAILDIDAIERWKIKNAEQLNSKDVGQFLVKNVCATAPSPLPSLLALMDKLMALGIDCQSSPQHRQDLEDS